MEFNVIKKADTGYIRAGKIRTSRNEFDTPCFMPVGTYAAVNGLTPQMVADLGAEILVCNALRLAEKPGQAVLSKFNSVHEFMAWDKTILTDSGGFQSRLKLGDINEQGIVMEADGKQTVTWTPERAIETQLILGSDFVMPLDICVNLPASWKESKEAMERTLRWAARCQAVFKPRLPQTLFGIIQGATYPDLRRQCIEALESMGFEAYAIGGLNVGESKEAYQATLDTTVSMLPENKLRYVMGVGRPEAMLEAVRAGVDIMDSIIPTKYARERTLFTYRGPLNFYKNKRLRRDKYPIDPNCTCYTCTHVTRAYMAHLYATTPTTAQVFGAIHNVSFCVRLLKDAHTAIMQDRFDAFYKNFLSNYFRK